MIDQRSDPSIGDAFGQTLSRCWQTGAEPNTTYEIVEREDGFIQAHDAARYFAEPHEWSPVERWACDQASGRVLDIGCGAGRHAMTLSAAGHDVVGIDPSPGAVEVSRARGVQAVTAALPDVPTRLGSFDTFVLLGNNLSLLGSDACRATFASGYATAPPPPSGSTTSSARPTNWLR